MHPFELGLGRVAGEEDVGPVAAGAVPAHEQVDVPDVVGLQDDHGRRGCRFEPIPDLTCARRRCERVEHDRLAARFDEKGRHLGLPVEPFAPIRVRLPPQPQAWSDVSDLHHPSRAYPGHGCVPSPEPGHAARRADRRPGSRARLRQPRLPPRRAGPDPPPLQRQALDRLPARVQGLAPRAAAATRQVHRAVLPRRGDRVRGRSSPVRPLPPR